MSGRKSEPPLYSRFRKGQSGNPKGRPKSVRQMPQPSVFDVLVDKTLTLTRGGGPQDVSIDEALQHRTYQEAITGNRTARRDVLKMIAKREQALAKKAPRPLMVVSQVFEEDPDNANAALLLLGIASEDPREYGPKDTYHRLLLEPWAVQAALRRRRGGARLIDKEVGEIRRCTRDPDSLKWPRGTRG
jgi:hypothetical protein